MQKLILKKIIRYHLMVLIIIFMFFLNNSSLIATPMMKLRINDISIDSEIANTNKSRKEGLMNRKKLKKNQGMLFIFQKPKTLSFWMKKTQIPLSIAFINSHGIITQIEIMKPFSLKHIISKKRSAFALEVNQGFFKDNNIKVGNEIIFE